MKAILTTSLLAASGGAEWSLGHEGISPAWALLLALALGAAAVWSYEKFTTAGPWLRRTLAVARTLTLTLLVILLTKPVLHLTLTEPVRQNLLVLLDNSESMAFADQRENAADLRRAAIAAGDISPDRGLEQNLPPELAKKYAEISRAELLQKLAANARLDLWRKLAAQTEMSFYTFGRAAVAAGTVSGPGGTLPTAADAEKFFKNLKTDQPATAIGDAVQQVLGENGNRRPDAVLLVTDGANNTGAAPLSAAQLARNLRVPLFIYGVGVTAPPDVAVLTVTPPKLAFARERAAVRAKISASGFKDKSVSVALKADGRQVDEQPLDIRGDGDFDVTLHFEPEEVGDVKLEVTVSALPGEINRENNRLGAKLRVTDAKFHVLFIEQEPRWDYRYLLAYLQRDRRLEVKCVVIDGESGLDQIEDSPFLPALPEDRETFFESQVLILGDVNPKDLGEERMELIAEWVEAGGGIIFLAGPNFNPLAYVDTPLQPLLPVTPDLVTSAESATQRQLEPFKLELTPAGAVSPYLQMSFDPQENQCIWDEFPGVRWTAPVLRAKPGAEVLLADSRPERAGRHGPAPVFAMQNYGAGMGVFIGTDETYRWRSHTGERYYSVFWGQVMQSLSLELLRSASAQTQLKTTRAQYTAGDTVTIFGNAYAAGYQPLLVPTLEGTLTVRSENADGKITVKKQPLNLAPVDGKNHYCGDFVASVPGEYTFTTARDDTAALRFTVSDPQLEKTNVSLNERALRAMAAVAGGQFLREENLRDLPGMLAEKESTVTVFKKKEIYRSAWWFAALLLTLTVEWLLRRLNQLK
ncbi:MAG: VWA domain-containing protein [Verrucomicrobiales bacterium]|jgi:hypothetical protein|nr:VWA domain-containing protein [Verrucomicrobiales bacterium]